MSMLATFKEVAERNHAQIEALRKESAELVKPLLQEFLKEHPSVKQISWTQYTPYFNDGEACTFGLHGFGFYFEGDDLEEGHYEHELPYKYDSDYAPEFRDKCDEATYLACKELEKQLNDAEDALESIFGDHCKVIVTAAGVEVEEYDHD